MGLHLVRERRFTTRMRVGCDGCFTTAECQICLHVSSSPCMPADTPPVHALLPR
jgi:hypothetical protein